MGCLKGEENGAETALRKGRRDKRNLVKNENGLHEMETIWKGVGLERRDKKSSEK